MQPNLFRTIFLAVGLCLKACVADSKPDANKKELLRFSAFVTKKGTLTDDQVGIASLPYNLCDQSCVPFSFTIIGSTSTHLR